MQLYNSTFKTIFAGLGFLLLGGKSSAQSPMPTPTPVDSALYHPYAPAGLPAGAPQWMERLTDVENVNYHAMTDSFQLFQRNHPEMRRKTPMTKAVINYFKRWQRAYRPYVQPDGRITVPSFADFRAFVEQMNAQAQQPRATRATQTLPWQVLTPMMTYHAEKKIAYPGQANVQRFDVAKTNPNQLYCGTETGMVFKSEDKGASWQSCTPDFYFGGEINTLEISYTDPNKVLVGAGAFLWLTRDGGKSWHDITPSQLRNNGRMVRDAVFHPTDDRQILVANTYGLFKTTDDGKTWTMLHRGECFDVKYKHGQPNSIYLLVRTENEVELRASDNGGQNFETRTLPIDYRLACGRIGLSAAPTGADYVYIIACKLDGADSYKTGFYFGTPVLFQSKDSGRSWTVHDKITAQMESYEVLRGQGYYDMMISASASDPEKLLFGLLDLYRSDDGGKTLMKKGGYTGQFELHADMQDIHVLGDDTWISTDGGITYSSDFFGQHAEARIKGIYASEFWGFDQGWNEDVMVGGRNHNGDMAAMDRYNGASLHLGGGETATGYVMLSNPRKVAFSDSNPKNVILPDDWREPVVPFLDFWSYPYEAMQSGMGLEFDPRYAKSFLIFKGNWDEERKTLWKTVDEGRSFVQLFTFPHPITAHVISRANPDKIVVGTAIGLYESLDGGQHFTPYENLPAEVYNSLSVKVAIHPRNADEIWIATENAGSIYRTKNNGKTWERMDQGLTLATGTPQNPTETVVVNRFFLTGNEKNAVYALGSVQRDKGNGYNVPRGRIFYRDDTTQGWQDYSEGLPSVITIARMLPFYKEGKVRIATNNGIWQRDLVDPQFAPIAQPLILNVGVADNKGHAKLEFDSYSIVNQNDVQWDWKFEPQPLSVSSTSVRNPIVEIAADQSYDVTLTVTTPQGSDTKTIRNMIKGKKGVITAIAGEEVLQRDIVLSAASYRRGEYIKLQPRGLDAPCQWQLFNSAGKVVDTQNVANTQATDIDTKALMPGVYFYLLTNASFKKTGKLIIQ